MNTNTHYSISYHTHTYILTVTILATNKVGCLKDPRVNAHIISKEWVHAYKHTYEPKYVEYVQYFKFELVL